ncbi:MAG: RHS repeat-associated core domain-containing protein [Bacteroidota bacterium]
MDVEYGGLAAGDVNILAWASREAIARRSARHSRARRVFDVFAERLDYDKNNNAYTGISQTSFNGNITSVAWQTKTPAGITGFTQERKGYIFQYDPVNQMTNSTSRADVTNPWVYNENATYDNLGNILSLTRQSNGSPLNSLTYNYTATGNIRGNRLLSVSDAGTEGQSSIYTYDTNGSVVTDSKKSITAAAPIVYNELSLPSLVTFTPFGKTLAYAYDATGKKLARTTATGGVTSEIRVYDNGIEYSGSTGTTLEFVHTSEGRAVKNGSNYNYQYQVTDHLGNVRALFADNPTTPDGKITADEIIQFTDYYPFGREISYPSLYLTPANNYKYNGKEFQTDLSEYDYGARFYDPVIARWNVVDPMAEVNRRFSTYNYVANNPITNIDPDGMDYFPGGGVFGGDLYTGESARGFLGGYREAAKKDGTDKDGESPPDYVEDNKTHKVYFDKDVHGPSDIKDGQTYVGKTTVAVNPNGDTIYGDENGQWWFTIMLKDAVTITEKKEGEDSGAEKVKEGVETGSNGIESVSTRLKDAGRLAVDDAELLENVKYLGQGLSAMTILSDINKYRKKDSKGNALRVVWDGLIIILGPEAGLVDGAFGASGYKDKMFKGVDNYYEKRTSKAAINSFKLTYP